MIIDLHKFVLAERPHWAELERLLNTLEEEPNHRMSLDQLRRFHYLYERAAADLARITTFSSEPETRRYLEHLVARGYGEIHETRERQRRIFPLKWFFQELPRTFRRHVRAFWLSLAITVAGCAFAGLAGLVRALALIGWGRRRPLKARLREVSRDMVTLIFGVGLLLVWAGFIEAFLSQYHEPVIPYSAKIAFGTVELALLILFLARSGKKAEFAASSSTA